MNMITQSTSVALMALAASMAANEVQAGNSPLKSSWEVSGEFDSSCPTAPSANNPWSYLSGPSMTGMGNPSTNPVQVNRCTDPSMPFPIVGQNKEEKFFIDSNPLGANHAARGLWLHPGAACEKAIVRFTAPYTGTYAVTGQFYGLDSNGTQTKTKVSMGPGIFTGIVDIPSGKIRASFRNSFLIPAGTPVDFVVGCQTPTGNYNYGITGLHAVIEYWGKGRQPKPLDNPFAGGSHIGTVDDGNIKDPQ
jgi:hypothetical protein